jgi:hypothetical protein
MVSRFHAVHPYIAWGKHWSMRLIKGTFENREKAPPNSKKAVDFRAVFFYIKALEFVAVRQNLVGRWLKTRSY